MQSIATETKNVTAKKEAKVKVKFNFPFANPDYNFQKALDNADDKKTVGAYFFQRTIDFNMPNSVYKAGSVHEINESLFHKLSNKFVKVFNPKFGEFKPDGTGKPVQEVEMLEVRHVLKVNQNNKVDRWDDERDCLNIDLYPEHKAK